MERAVILEFPTCQLRDEFITALKLVDHTLHKEKPVLYCCLSKPEIEKAVRNFQAKDTSYNDNNNYLFNGFLDTLAFPD